MALKIDSQWWLEVDDVATLERITRREVYRRVAPGDPHHLISRDRRQVDGKRGILIYAHSLSFEARNRWQEARLGSASSSSVRGPETPDTAPLSSGTPADPSLSASGIQSEMFRVSPEERRLLSLPEPAERKVAWERFNAVQPLMNHDWKALGFESKTKFVQAKARALGVSQPTLWRWYDRLIKTRTDQLECGDPLALASERPGPAAVGAGASSIDASLAAFLKICWEEKKLTRAQCVEAAKDYLRTKQRGCGASYAYEFPSDSTIRRFINERLGGDENRARGPREGLKVAAGHIMRSYDDQFAGDAWCIDEWELDGAFFDEQSRSRLINYGGSSPVAHLVSVIDERTTCILDWTVTLSLSQETSLDLFERLLRKHPRPNVLVSDRGGAYRGKLLRRRMVHSREQLFEKLDGALGVLGIAPRQPREKNPRSNRIERMHRIYAAKARRDFGPSWRGANTTERKELTTIDENVKRHMEDHCKHGLCGPQLLSIQEAERLIAKWVEEINLAETDAEGCKGLTRLAAFRQFQPPAEDAERRRISPAMLERAFAEEFADRTIQPGGFIELPDGMRYQHPLLDASRGECRRVARLRHDRNFIIVLPDVKGEEPLAVERAVRVGTKDQASLSAAFARQTSVRNVLEEFARREPLAGSDAPAVVVESVKPTPVARPALSAEEFVVTDRAKTSAAAPSLYDLDECTVEQL